MKECERLTVGEEEERVYESRRKDVYVYNQERYL